MGKIRIEQKSWLMSKKEKKKEKEKREKKIDYTRQEDTLNASLLNFGLTFFLIQAQLFLAPPCFRSHLYIT